MLKNIKFEEVTLEKAVYLSVRNGIHKIQKYGQSVHIEAYNGCGYFVRLTKVKDTGLVIAFSHEKNKYYLLKGEENFEELIKAIDCNYRGNFNFREILLLPNDYHKCAALSSLGRCNILHIWNSGYMSLSVTTEDFKDAENIQDILILSKIISLKFIGEKGDIPYQIS